MAPNKKYENKLDATLEYVDGGRGVLSLNVTNLTALSKRWGTDSDAWLNQEIELSDDQVPFGNGYVDSVVVKPISPPIPKVTQRRRRPQEVVESSTRHRNRLARSTTRSPFMPERR